MAVLSVSRQRPSTMDSQPAVCPATVVSCDCHRTAVSPVARGVCLGVGVRNVGAEVEEEGNLLGRAGHESFGDEPGRFYSPHGITVDSHGDVYVAEVSWSDYGSRMDPPRELRSMQKLVKID